MTEVSEAFPNLADSSPLFRMEIWAALQHELNRYHHKIILRFSIDVNLSKKYNLSFRLYEMFTTRNPHFEANGGKVSIISHSLGEYPLITQPL